MIMAATASPKAVWSEERIVWSRYLNRCTRAVIAGAAQGADTLRPKGMWSVYRLKYPVAWTLWPPASRRDLTDPVIGPERGKPDLLRPVRKANRKECRWEAG